MSLDIMVGCVAAWLIVSVVFLVLIIVFHRYNFMFKILKLYPVVGLIIIVIMVGNIFSMFL